MQPSDDQIAIRETTRTFVRNEITPFAAEWDRTATVPVDTVRRIGALGLFGITIAPEWDGAGADFMSYLTAIEELAYGDAGICNTVTATNSFCFRLRDFGTEDQKERFLRPVAGGAAFACMLLTEPHAGSDASNLKTRAERRGDRWVVNGEKCLITSGSTADFAILIATTDPEAPRRGVSAFVIRPNSPGYKVLRRENKLGHRTNDTCHILLEDMEIPAEDMLGAPGDGLRVALSGLESGRIGCAAQALGVARAAFDAAFAYARDRVAFGKTIYEHQAVAFELADMATEIEAARRLCEHAARMKQEGLPCLKESSMAKLYTSRMCERVCSAAIQIHGGHGFTDAYPVEKYYRDQRVFQLYDGTNEIQKLVISRELAAGR